MPRGVPAPKIVRKVRAVDPVCDICWKHGGVRQFGLTLSVKVDGRFTRRGVGSIRLCDGCWRETVAPRRYLRERVALVEGV